MSNNNNNNNDNNQSPHEEENMARLLRAGFNETARPDAQSRQRAWEQIKTEWGEHPAPHDGRWKLPPFFAILKSFLARLLKNPLAISLGTLGAAAAAIIILIAVVSPTAQVKAAQVMAQGARVLANLTSIHLRGQLRASPTDNFSSIDARQDFLPIELWKEFSPENKWRVEKTKRVVVMDGHSVTDYWKNSGAGWKYKDAIWYRGAEWLLHIANLSATIEKELDDVKANGWKMDYVEKTGPDGRLKYVVTVHTKSGIPDGDYGKNGQLESADTRRVYQFDVQTERLDSVKFFLVDGVKETKIFELSQIDYNPPIDPSIWNLDVPAGTVWGEEPQILPDNEKYATMPPEEAARAFFEACGREDWEEAGKFVSPITQDMKDQFGGVKIINIGKSFTSKTYDNCVFVPYFVRLQHPPQVCYMRLDNTNSAHRYVITGSFDDKFDPDEDNLNWTTEPAILPDNDAYAAMSPAEVANAFFEAAAREDLVELRKFVPESAVKDYAHEIERAKRDGTYPQLKAALETKFHVVGDAFWSGKLSAWLVKYTVDGDYKKFNLCISKNNPAGRWQVLGGY